uniref:Uncharacterized protein n=1 Tax=Panagrolaimus sp. ES5 TaxID=591445 RepID=A0AC34FCH4_9BILA
MSEYSSRSRRRHRDEPSSSDRRPYGFVYPDLNDNDRYEDDRRNDPYDDEDDYDYPRKDHYKDRDYRRRDRYEDDDRHRGRYEDDEDYYEEDEQNSGNFLTQIFWFIYTLFTSPLTILARAGLWILSTILMFTPLYPVYLLFQKGTNVFGWIGNSMGFIKDLLAIVYNCVADVSNNHGYMTNKLPADIRRAFSKLLGYQSNNQEIIDDDDENYRVRGDGLKKRAMNAAMYATSMGNYPKNLSGLGSPQNRYGSRESGGNKSGIVSMLLSIGGMIYYVLTGQFLYNNNNNESDGYQNASPSRRQRRRFEEQKKKSYMRGILGFVVIMLVLWWLFASGNLQRGIQATIGKVLSIFASLAFWAIKKSFYLFFWIPSFFFRSNNQGYPTPSATDTTNNYGQYVQDMPDYLTNATSGAWKYIAESLFSGMNATTLSQLTNSSPSEIGDILYRQFTRSLRWGISQLISGCFHANVCH